MNMNTLLNEDNEGYSWEGDYEQTWLEHGRAVFLCYLNSIRYSLYKGKKYKRMRRAPFAQPLTISPTDHVRGKCSKNNPISDCPWLDFGVYYFVKRSDGIKIKY